MLGFVRRIIPFSSVDGPGNRTAVFLQGCNFRCLYCHNPETQAVSDGVRAILGVAAMDHLEVVDAVLLYRDFIRGVTISGGECTVQLAFLVALCKTLQENNIEVFVDTNGHVDPQEFTELCQHVDKFMFDVKAWGDDEHLALTGHTPSLVQANLRYAIAHKKVYEVRTVIVPDVLSNHVTVAETSRLISADPDIRYKLIKFRQRGVEQHALSLATPDDRYMEDLAHLATRLGVKDCRVL